MRAKPSLAERFWERVDALSGECWLWTGQINSWGYGQLKDGAKMFMAHRLAYEIVIGPVPDGLELDHLCRVRHCVNPEHLEAVTPRVNKLRSSSWAGINARKTHCKRGHEFTPENTHITSLGGRSCRACRRQKSRCRSNEAA